ncbi:hypothetical protein L7F22_030593 [Adiantum nelumboides]|nr:hypothetical protein [Adiantum nelumboides]
MHTFLQRVNQTPSPYVVAWAVQGVVARTHFYEVPMFHGDRETIQEKRSNTNFATSSHKPGYVMESRQRREHGHPRKISFLVDGDEGKKFDVNLKSTGDDIPTRSDATKHTIAVGCEQLEIAGTFDMADQEQRKIFLTYLRSTLCAMVSGLNNRQMRATVENEALTEEFVEKAFSKAISLVSFLVLREKAQQSTYNIIGNMEKCANDLQANLSPDVDLEKLKNWDTNWRVEKIKCKQASETDTQHVFSKKMRIKLAADSLNSAGTEEPASLLKRSRRNSECTLSLGIPHDAIEYLERLGSGSFGTCYRVCIHGITYFPSDINYVAKKYSGLDGQRYKSFEKEDSIDLRHSGIVRNIGHSRGDPWVTIFSFFINGRSVGELMQCLPFDNGTFKRIVKMEAGGDEIKKTDMAKKEIVIALHHEGKETKHVLGFVLLKEGGKFKELREEIDSGGLASEGYSLLGGSQMLPISQKQEEMWIVSSDEVLIEYTSCEDTPSKRPRVDSSGASNDIDTISPVSQKESETPNLSTSTDIRWDESGKGSHLKSLFASRSKIKKWQRDIETMKEKLRLKGRKDRFELMAKDKEGKTLF